MSVRVDGDRVWLEGDCRAADADALCLALVGRPELRVDVSRARALHTAVIQALLALRPAIEGDFSDAFLHRFVTPRLRALP